MNTVQQLETTSAFSQEYSIANKQKTEEKDDKNQFLDLMIAQLENQDPLSPQENGEFLAQLAQFSSVDGIERLNETMSSFTDQFRSSQALQATALVGRNVQVPNSQAWLSGPDGVSGLVDVPVSTSNVQVEVLNSQGEMVRSFPLGTQAAGDVSFTWDGLNQDSQPMPNGAYTIKATSVGDEGPYELETYISANVDSVTINQAGGVALNIPGLGSVDLSEVKQIE